jgi:hypothetical protein
VTAIAAKSEAAGCIAATQRRNARMRSGVVVLYGPSLLERERL